MTHPGETPLRVLVTFGTRPEAIKLAPVVQALRSRPDRFETVVCTTAQHRDMVDQVEGIFELEPDMDLDLMTPDQALNELTARVVGEMDGVIERTRPSWLVVQGDTTTAMAAALAAFHQGVRIGHVEAGLRTGDLAAPFPEEANRRIIDVLASACFAPTRRAVDALLAEGVDPSRVHLTGNTIVDALLTLVPSAREDGPRDEVLVTVHRRESFGAPLRGILGAVAQLASSFPELRWVCPVHPNPNVRGPANQILGEIPNIELHEPLTYRELLRHLERTRLVLTDSGGIQEEAPSFGTPVLVLRTRTERPEGIEAGIAHLVGTDPSAIVAAATEALTGPRSRCREPNPYGDGHAAGRIVAILAGEAWDEPAGDR